MHPVTPPSTPFSQLPTHYQPRSPSRTITPPPATLVPFTQLHYYSSIPFSMWPPFLLTQPILLLPATRPLALALASTFTLCYSLSHSSTLLHLHAYYFKPSNTNINALFPQHIQRSPLNRHTLSLPFILPWYAPSPPHMLILIF